MAVEVGKAYVQIVPKTEGFKSKLTSSLGGDVASAGSEAGESFGSNLVSKIKGILAAAGIGAIIKETLEAGGALQQSFGGLDTLYGEASQAAKDYAREAASAGISMNDYAEQAVSFGAALKQAFAGADNAEELAANAANTAILDMADNAAKMGSDIGSIQSAYQGFAKQNYTMLDNLKLGYGGTKSEMERLLKDASQLEGAMGKTFDINNLGDVYEAIHLIQDDLGLTGVAAQEASETFTGSFGAMKASVTNLMADIATGNTGAVYDDIQALFQSVETFVFDNLGPMLANILGRLPQLIANFIFEIGDLLKQGASNASVGVDFAIQLLANLVDALVENIPYLLEGAVKMAIAIADALINYDWIGTGQMMMNSFKASIDDAVYYIFGEDTNLLDVLMDWLTKTLPEILEKGVDMIISLVQGIIQALPNVVTGIATVIAKLLAALYSHYPEIIQSGFELLGKLIAGIIKCIPDLIMAIPKVIAAIVDTFGAYDWKQIGIDILVGIKNGIVSAIKQVVEAAKAAAAAIFDAVKGYFNIGSPSKLMRDEIGKWIPAGIAVGIEANTKSVENAMNSLAKNTVSAGKIDFSANVAGYSNAAGGSGTVINQTLNVTTTDNSPDEIARTIRLESRYGLMIGGALG